MNDNKTITVYNNINDDDNRSEQNTVCSDASSVFYTVTPYRWVVLACVFLLNVVNAALWLSYSPIADAVAKHFDVSSNSVNMLSLCLSATYGPVVWSAAPVVKRLGFGWTTRLAICLSALGAVIRYFGQGHSTFGFLVFGQVMSGLARPFISQLLGLVSLKWFPNQERVLATAVAALGNPFGIGLGMGLSPVIVHSGDSDDQDEVGDQFRTLNLIHMIFATVVAVFVCLCVRERPKHDPSEAAIADRNGENDVPFLQEVRLLWNPQYWIVALAFGFGFGQINCIAVIINQLLKPFGYSHSIIGLTGVMTIVPGVIGASAIAAFLGKRPLHREALIAIYFAGAILLQAMMLSALRSESKENMSEYVPILLVVAGLFGFFSQPCFSVALELASETVYPASPSVSAAGVVMMGQYMGLVMSLSLGDMIGEVTDSGSNAGSNDDHSGSDIDTDQQNRVHIAGYIMSGCFLIAGLLMVMFKKSSMARMQYEAEQKARKKALKNEEKRRLRSEERRSQQYSTLQSETSMATHHADS